MKPNRKNFSPKPHRRWRRLIITAAVGLTIFSVVSFSPQPAEALLGVGDVSVTVGDIPRIIFQFIDKAQTKIRSALKVATDIAFKNSLEIFNAKIAQEIVTQVSTAGPGQKPLFLTNPKTFFRNVANSAAGTFIDEFTRGLTGQRGPSGPFTSSRQRFLISRLLRSSVNPLEQCRQDCRVTYSVDGLGADANSSSTAQDPKDVQGNDHYKRVYLVNYTINTVTKPAYDLSQTASIVCRHVETLPGPPPPGQTYMPWRIVPGACEFSSATCDTTTKECLRRQREAINNERANSRLETNQCLRDCQSGVDSALTRSIQQLTATDVFAAVGSLDPAEAPSYIANALRRDRSDIGQLLGAAASLSATVQSKITGEQTNLSSGTIPRTSRVSEVVLVPREANQQSLLTALTGGSTTKQIYTGTSAADVIKGISAFINSPIGRLLATYFNNKCGLNPDACRGPSQPQSQLGQLLFGSGGPTGVAGAKLQFAQFGQVEFLTGDPGRNEVDVGEELTTSGLIDAQFRTAIQDRLTVKEALDRRLLDPRKAFGFDPNGAQTKEGYPFRALQYLRKFRVTPVGWELAAEYSRRFDPRSISLGFLTQQYPLCGNTLVCSNSPNDFCAVDEDCALPGKPSNGKCGLPEGESSRAVCDNTNPDTYLKSCQVNGDCGAGGTCGPSPYCGLVDPNWVLKAPQTYCRRQGAGEEILTKEFVCDVDNVESTADVGGGRPLGQNAPNCLTGGTNNKPDIGRWVIARNANTCADTQSCIAENDDGTCIGYGYCVQERQAFKFDGVQCSPENASCTTYTDEAGIRNAYLANTLDFRSCSADVAGCKWYCQNFVTADTNGDGNPDNTWSCSDTSGDDDKINFSDNVQLCASSQNGCNQYIRTTNGSNILPNSGFERFSGADIDSGQPVSFGDGPFGWQTNTPTRAVTSDDPGVAAANAVALNMPGGTFVYQTIDTGHPLYERVFVGSIRAKSTGSCNALLHLNTTGTLDPFTTMDVTDSWRTFSVLLQVPAEGSVVIPGNTIDFAVDTVGCGEIWLDSAQLEEGSQTQYKDYGTVNALYLNATRRQCTTQDVGCESYTRLSNRQQVNATVRASNRCTEDKVGCATYELEPITSTPARPGGTMNIVAPRGQQCSAANVGCEEYTNLDEVARGGEGREYFRSVRQCVQPNHPGARTYYTWVGDATRGFVLRAYDLLKHQDAGVNRPCTRASIVSNPSDTPVCADDASSLSASACSPAQVLTDPDCAEYFDSDLVAHYLRRSKTVSVTAECRPYRNSVDQTDADNSNDGNLYFLATRENIRCPESANTCRAYTGNAGRTTRTIFSDSLENATVANWEGGQPSSQSVNLGGHSMMIPSGEAAYTRTSVLQNLPQAGQTYLVSFIAAAGTDPVANPPATITVALGIGSGSTFTPEASQLFSGAATLNWNTGITPPGPEWQSYTLGPLRLPGPPSPNLGIMVNGGAPGGSAYVDNIVLTEITDHVYLLSNSVPSCDQADVGCDAFRDRAGQRHFLKSFTRLCSEEVVGCEALIDTKNSNTPFRQTVKNELTPADTVVTLVNNRSAYCPAVAKGCQALGLPIYATDTNISDFKTVYLKNDPDRHLSDLCLNSELMCRAYTTTDGTAAFFKDPRGQTCEFRTDNTNTGGQWFVSGTNFRCPSLNISLEGRPVGASCAPVCTAGDRAGRACLSDTDCPGATCNGDPNRAGRLLDGTVGQCTDDANCDTDATYNNCVYQTGSCPESESGCNEYRDPSDPLNCRSECPLVQQGGSPVYMDQSCVRTSCTGNAQTEGQNCQTNAQCGDGGTCIGLNGNQATGLAGCRSYFYLRQSVEERAGECNGEIDLATGCRPFNDTSKTNLNFRGN